jgi:hypothetical protein
MFHKRIIRKVIVVAVLVLLCLNPANIVSARNIDSDDVSSNTSSRHGGWLDEIDFSVVPQDSALTQLQAGTINIYGNGFPSSSLPMIQQAGLSYSSASGMYL